MRLSSRRRRQLWCYSCGKTFPTDSDLKTHMKSHGTQTRKKNDQKKQTVQGRKIKSKSNNSMTFTGKNVNRKLKPQDESDASTFVENGIRLEEVNNDLKCEKPSEVSEETTTKTDVKEKAQSCVCDICGKVLQSEVKLKYHAATHKRKEGQFKCDICLQTFPSALSLTGHQKKHAVVEKEFICSVVECSKTFYSRCNFKKHMKCHSDEKSFLCNVCGKAFRTKTHLQNHSRTHTGERPFVCSVCNKTFSQPGNLHMHKKLHTNDRKYICEVCGKRFIQKVDLQGHMYKHTQEKPYSCTICGKKYGLHVSLSYHMKTHQPRPYQYHCEICNQDCMTRSFLNTHMKYHSGIKPHTCDICGKSFTMSHGLKRHKRKHATVLQYKCTVCDKSYKYTESLHKHMTTHGPGEKFRCATCNKDFPYMSSLRQHQVVHSGIKPFKCQRCDKEFNLKGNLKKHMVKCPLTKEIAVQCDDSTARKKSSKDRKYMDMKKESDTIIQLSTMAPKTEAVSHDGIQYDGLHDLKPQLVTVTDGTAFTTGYVQNGDCMQSYDDTICSEIIVPMDHTDEETIIIQTLYCT